MLRGVGEHYNLRRDMPGKKSQLPFERDDNGTRCLVYREDYVTKTHDGGIRDMRRDRKVVWVHPNVKNPERCPVTLTDKYVGLCPFDFTKKENFYLQSKQKPNPAVWYGREVLGTNSIGKVIGDLMHSAGYTGFFSGHSLRRSSTTRLFQAGVQRKLVKECTGHTSDAVDKYQVTSENQRATISNILESKPKASASATNSKISEVAGTTLDEKVTFSQVIDNPVDVKSVKSDICAPKCSCTKSQYGGLIEQIISQVNASGKAKIKIEIEVSKE